MQDNVQDIKKRTAFYEQERNSATLTEVSIRLRQLIQIIT